MENIAVTTSLPIIAHTMAGTLGRSVLALKERIKVRRPFYATTTDANDIPTFPLDLYETVT